MQVIEFQLSQANFADQGTFYINAGLGFDALWASAKTSSVERPKIHECHLQKRIEELLPDAPSSWHVSSESDTADLANEIRVWMTLLMSELDRMRSTAGVLQGNWLKVGSERILKGRLFYVTGDVQSAMIELRAAADFFADRQGMSIQELVQRYSLVELAPLL